MLYKHQQEFLNKNINKTGLWWQTGTGKTIAAIEWSKRFNEEILIICPKSLVQNWYNETNKYCLPIKKTFIYSKENFKKYATANSLCKFNTIIVDEAHYFFNEKSQMSKSLIDYINKFKVNNILLLTATPHNGKNHLMVYTIAKILGKDYNWFKFRQMFYFKLMMGKREIWQPKTDEDTIIKIQSLIRQNGDIISLKDCVDLPEVIFQIEYFELTPEQKTKIKLVKITESNPIKVWTQVHQICGGSLKGDTEYNVPNEFFKSEKLNRLLELISEHKKLIVVCRYNNEISMIKALIKKPVLVINGDTKDKQLVVENANKFDECVLIFQASCGFGHSLPTFQLMIFYSYDFALTSYVQMIGRIQRINAVQKCVYLSLVVKDSIDEDVYNCVMDKKDFQIDLYNP